MEALIPGMLIWICLQIGCEPPPPPDILFVSQEMLLERVYGDKLHEGAYVCGLYDDKTQTVWLPHECRPDDLLNQSTLLHELVHHVQTVKAMVYPCPPSAGAARVWTASAVVDGKGHRRPLCRDGGRSVHDHASVTLLAGGVESARSGESVLATAGLPCRLRQAGAVKNREFNRRHP